MGLKFPLIRAKECRLFNERIQHLNPILTELTLFYVCNETVTLILPAKLSKILLKPSPGESGMGVADDITWSTSNSNENGFMAAQGLFGDLG